MGGLNVQEETRARELNMPIIFVSGLAYVPIVVRAFKVGHREALQRAIAAGQRATQAMSGESSAGQTGRPTNVMTAWAYASIKDVQATRH